MFIENFIIIVLIVVAFYFLRGTFNARKSDKRISNALMSRYGYNSAQANFLWSKYNKQVIGWEIDGLNSFQIADKIVELEKDVKY